MRLSHSLAIALLAGSSLSQAAVQWCPVDQVWADDCMDPTIQIFGPTASDTVTMVGGAISITYATVAKDVAIVCPGSPVSVGSVSISAGGAGAASSNWYSLSFDNVDNLGSVSYSGLGGLSVTGTVTGDLTGTIQAASIGSAASFGLTIEGDVTSSGGVNLVDPILSLSSGIQIWGLGIGGDLKGDIIADYGHIGLSGGSGTVGIGVAGAAGEFNPATSTDNPVLIRSGGNIELFSAGSLNGTLTAPSGNIQQVLITKANGGSGQFVGLISGQKLADGGSIGPGMIEIEGDLGARYVSGSTTLFPGEITFVSSSPSNYAEILIGGDYIESSEINLPANDVGNRILINADMADSNEWESDADIAVGSVLMTNPQYSAIPSSFGGGVIAELPYRQHAEWSSPENYGDIVVRKTDPSSLLVPPGCLNMYPMITIRTYGPVYESGSGAPLRIERQTGTDPMSGQPIYADVTGDFTIDMATTYTSADRDIEIEKTSGAWTKGRYRISYDRDEDEQSSGTGDAEILFKLHPLGGAPAYRMASFEHFVDALDTCGQELLMTFDLNGDDNLCVLDAGEWTASPIDFNDDECADSTDMSMLLQAIDNYHAND